MFHTRGQFLTFLESVFGSMAITGPNTINENFNVICPFCEEKHVSYTKKKLAIKDVNGAHLTKCWVCGYKSKNLLEILKKYYPNFLSEYITKFLSSKPLDNHVAEANKLDCTLPPGFRLLTLYPDKKSFQYLVENRNIHKDELEYFLWRYRLGISHNEVTVKDRIIFPSHNGDGEINCWSARTILSNVRPKYLYPKIHKNDIIFNEIDIFWNQPLVLVEGPMDLIKCTENATCLMGSELNENHKLFEKIVLNRTEILLVLDKDASNKIEKISNLLMDYGISVKLVELPLEYSDVGEMTKNEFKDLIKTAHHIDKTFQLKNKIKNLLL